MKLVFLNAILSIADIISILLVFIILNIYSDHASTWLLPYLQKFNFQQPSLIPAVILILVFIIKSVAGYFIIKAQSRYIAAVSTRLSSQNLLTYFKGRYADFINIDSSVWMRRIYFQAIEFSQYVLAGIQQIINETILILISITALIIYNAKVLLVVILVLLPAIFLLIYIAKKRLTRARKNIQTANEISLQYLNESIAGFVESNLYNKNDFFTERYKKSQFILNRFIADMQVTQLLPNRFFEVFAVLGLFIIVIINFNYGDSSKIYLLGAFIAAAYKIIPGISKIINYSNQVKTYSFTAKELAATKTIRQVAISHADIIKKIEFRNVCLNYNEKEVFINFNCVIEPGNFIGIQGISGKGKTTLINLLLGFLSPNFGNVHFNDEPTEAKNIQKFWPQIAYVKQTNFLLHDSILNNIILYNDTYDQKKLSHIIQVTGLQAWLDDLPEGLNTIINEGGKNISGGQKQRIAIARALYKDAALLILDEPFNELDESSELSLLHYFKFLSKKDKTILLITHNTNSFNFCDSIINLDEKK